MNSCILRLTALLYAPLLCLLATRTGAAEGPPVITSQPASTTVLQGNQATFSVTVDGTVPFTYQWLRNGAPIVNATNNVHTRTAAPADNEALFSVLVTNSMGNTASSNATLRVDPGMPGSSYTTNGIIPLSSQSWRYFTTGTDLGTAWRDLAYNDTAWPQGQALFGVEAAGIYAEPFRTVFSPYNAAIVTYYFRTHFTFSPTGNVHGVLLSVSGNIDDGAAFYLNGTEIGRVRLAAGATATTTATGDNEGGTETFSYVATTELVPGDNVLAVEVHQQSTTSSDVVFGMGMNATITNRVPDATAPTVVPLNPVAGQTVQSLSQVEILFSEPVQGVNASDLLLNGVPATGLTFVGPAQYVFQFASSPTGSVTISFTNTHGITDFAVQPNAFAAASWSYTVDPQFNPGSFRITEFLANNNNGLRDDDGDRSDWIEIYNPGTDAASLQGWFLTDDPLNPTKWKFPYYVLNANSYYVVFASNKDRTNTAGGAKLHTSFQLKSSDGYLALVNPNSNVVSAFGATYPQQSADVSYGRDLANPELTGFYTTPTPGAANSTRGTGFAPEVQFSVPSGTFTIGTPVSVTLSTPGVANASIYYTFGTNVPTQSSALYTSPLSFPTTTVVRARAFVPSLLPGPISTRGYIALDGTTNTTRFNSGLPIVILHNYGQGAVLASKAEQFVFIETFENDTGRSALTNRPSLASRAVFHVRGSSTAVQSDAGKSQFFLELRAEDNFERSESLLGLPAESDWVLYAPNNFEPALFHNPLAHAWFRDMGRYGSRTRFVELYLKDNAGASGPITAADYNGVYVLEEKVKRDPSRVDIARLDPEDVSQPAITGGYLLAVDRTPPGEAVVPVNYTFPNNGVTLNYVSPTGFAMTNSLRAPQTNYIARYMNQFNTDLNGVNYTNLATTNHYSNYMDVDSWIDLHIHETITFNVDGMRLSGYLFKDRNKKLEYGPTWDYDRTQGSTDGRDINPRVWQSTSGDLGTDFFNPQVSIPNVPWWGRLFTAPDFWQAWIDRYQDLRKGTNGPLSLTNIFGHIQRFYDQLVEAEVRDQAKWGRALRTATGGAGGTYATEVQWKRNWYSNRLDFADTQFLAPPTINVVPGPLGSATTVTITAASGLGNKPANSQIIVTLDGTDPRLSGGAVATGPNVLVSNLSMTLALTNTVRLVARSRNVSHANFTGAHNPPISSPWSGKISGTYYFTNQTPPLRVTEIMYHPAVLPGDGTNDVDNFEYVEFKNISGASLNVTGFRLRGGIEFDFPILTLNAGQSCVVVADVTSFQSRYGTNNPNILIAGSYTNAIGHDRLGNGGDHIKLESALRQPILDFDYSDGWYPSTDGAGFALQIVDENAAIDSWGSKSSWRASGTLAGSPGTNDAGAVVVAPIVINEILTHTDLPQVDAVELYNPTGGDVNIGGWFLTDNFSNPKRYRIAAGTTVPAGSYLVLYSSNSFGSVFDLASRGEEVYLFSGDANTNLTGYVNGFDFGAQANGVTFGRYLTSTGIQYPVQSVPTLGTVNAGPKVGPIVISEIMYHPPDTSTIEGPRDNDVDEYVELENITAQPQPLFDTNFPANTWQLRDAVSFTFPTNLVIPAGGHVLVVSFDPLADPLAESSFRSRNAVFPGTPVLGPYGGQLDNSGDAVELVRPDVPQPPAAPDAGAVYQILVDKVNYSHLPPWPIGTDGFGFSLQRLVVGAFGNDATNWIADIKTPGFSYNSTNRPVITMQPQDTTVLSTMSASFSVTATGTPPLFYQWFYANNLISGATNSLYVIPSVTPGQSGNYRCLIQNSDGAIFSSNGVLTVIVAASITQQPVNQFLNVSPDPFAATNSTATFTLQATTQNGPLSYRWRRNGTNLPLDNPNITGVTGNVLTVTNAVFEDAGYYSCALTDQAGTVFSAEAVLGVKPYAVKPPASQVITPGANIHMGAAIQAFPPPFLFKWQRGNTPIGVDNFTTALTNFATFGSTTNGFVLTGSQVSNSFEVRLLITNLATTTSGQVMINTQGVQNLFGPNIRNVFVLIDTDMDGIPNQIETNLFGMDTNNAADALGDLDGDGMSNLAEFRAGTDPTNAASYLKVELAPLGGLAEVRFAAVSNRLYTVQFTDTVSNMMPAMAWTRLVDVLTRSTNRVETFIDPNWTSNRFYRVVTPRAP